MISIGGWLYRVFASACCLLCPPLYDLRPVSDYTEAVNPKLQPNRKLYLEALRRMTPSQRLAKAIELSELGKRLLRQGLKRRFPQATEQELHSIFLKQLERCHNRNY